ncbi:MAG: 2-dehydro-3-deoxygalactonokinase [bacterium]
MNNGQYWITLDGGTTNTRACLISDGIILDTATQAVGVRNSDDPANEPVKKAVAEVLGTLCSRHGLDANAVRVVASGMIGSDAGLCNVPHVIAPASMSMARNAMKIWHEPEYWPGRVEIYPGIKTVAADSGGSLEAESATADIMRGEEVQAWGLRRRLATSQPELARQPWLLLWPGSHTKLIRILPDGSIGGSFTSLAGELFAAMKSATLLKRSLTDATAEAFTDDIIQNAAGCVRQFGLLRAAFWTRVADINATIDAPARTAWLSAAVTAADCQGLCRHPWLADAHEKPLLFIGGDPLRQSLYARLISLESGITPILVDAQACDQAAAIGVSCVAGLLQAE